MSERPPRWAEVLLQLVLTSADRDCVSGDLLEQYRDEIVPARGQSAAARWYVRQVCGYLWRAAWPWAAVFAAGFLARTVYDWRVPTTDFLERSRLTTAFGATTLVGAAFWGSRRSRSVLAGLLLAGLTTQIAAVFSLAGVTVALLVWHDAGTMRAIAGSGGLMEAYTLPFMTIGPAIVGGTIAGTIGRLSRGFH